MRGQGFDWLARRLRASRSCKAYFDHTVPNPPAIKVIWYDHVDEPHSMIFRLDFKDTDWARCSSWFTNDELMSVWDCLSDLGEYGSTEYELLRHFRRLLLDRSIRVVLPTKTTVTTTTEAAPAFAA